MERVEDKSGKIMKDRSGKIMKDKSGKKMEDKSGKRKELRRSLNRLPVLKQVVDYRSPYLSGT